MILLGLRSLNTKPKFRAADTKAASSGDCAWYSNFPENKQVFILLNFFILKIIIIFFFPHLYTVYLQLETWKKNKFLGHTALQHLSIVIINGTCKIISHVECLYFYVSTC